MELLLYITLRKTVRDKTTNAFNFAKCFSREQNESNMHGETLNFKLVKRNKHQDGKAEFISNFSVRKNAENSFFFMAKNLLYNLSGQARSAHAAEEDKYGLCSEGCIKP